ncbi:FG-GAP repeat domain-containing protein [Kordia sp.]|uniref:FG-GAP repeat domain-containing protein n=1 Tax=Kordia sp. TaxID=1965332 RepID=UPI003D284A85
MLKKILKVIGVIILLLIIFVLGFFWRDSVSDKYDITIDDSKIPLFEEIALDFKHQYNGEKSLPLAPSALIDINNDHVDEVFFGGGMNQEDAIFAYRNNKFVNISSEVNLPKKGNTVTTVGIVSADFDNNGFTDILLGREDGLTIYYNTDGKFTPKKIDTPINENQHLQD